VLDFAFTKQFQKDYKLMEKRHYDMDEIIDIICMIIWQEPLPARCREHKLSGNYAGFTECHIKNDWIMIYIIDEEKVHFSFTGTHSDYL
jgi:mRNA interferase YafQ